MSTITLAMLPVCFLGPGYTVYMQEAGHNLGSTSHFTERLLSLCSGVPAIKIQQLLGYSYIGNHILVKYIYCQTSNISCTKSQN